MSDDLSTTAQVLAWATAQLRPTSNTPRLDAEMLLTHVLGWGRARLLAESGVRPAETEQAVFRELVARRAALEPIAYLTGHREFYGLDFIVDRRVLVPRPETELLVDLALRYAHEIAPRHPLVIADIGTGSGCIAVTVATQLPGALVYATDVSRDALRVASENLTRHGVRRRVHLVEGDLLEALPEPVDLLLSNPPYTVLSDIDESVRRYEPHLALDGGPDGLDVYRRLLAEAPTKLRQGGAVMVEIGAAQGAALVELAQAYFPAARINLHQDLAGLDRVVVISQSDDKPDE